MTTPREQLADLLKQARIDAGYSSQKSLAIAMKLSRPVITKAENPTQPIPSDTVLAAWSKTTKTSLDELEELAERCRSGIPEWLMPFVTAEAVAKSLRFWHPLLVPGLLQTEDYARALLSVEPYSREKLDELVTARMGRKHVLDKAYITVAVDARVLKECVGSPAIMAAQCAFLIAAAERPNVALHVVPHGANVGTWGGIALAAGPDGSTVLCLNSFEDVTSTTPELVDSATRSYERILGAALPVAQSLDFAREQEEAWKTQM